MNCSSACIIGMAEVLPIIDVLGYDEENNYCSSSPSPSDSTPITQKGSHILHGFVDFHNEKRLVILTQ